MALLVAVYGSLIRKEATVWWHAATSSSRQQGQRDEELKERWQKAAWELACRRHDVLPAAHYLLLELVGCSSKALLWAATEDYNAALACLEEACSVCHRTACEHVVKQLDTGRSSSVVPETSAVFLWHAVLLHWAWHYLQENPGELVDLGSKPSLPL
jgi:hypothetical protein